MNRELCLAAVLLFLATRSSSSNPIDLRTSTGHTFAAGLVPLVVVWDSEDDAQVSCTRTVSAGEKPGSLRIQVTINKSSTTGFARYSDVLPKGMSVESVITDGSSFSIADGKVRFIWVSAPAREVLNIEYTLVARNVTQVRLKGEYSYLDANRTRKFEFATETFDVPVQGRKKEENKAVSTSQPQKTSTKESVPRKSRKKEKDEVVKAASATPVSGIVFRVQVGAFKSKRASASRLKKKFKLTVPLMSEMADGYTKYMTGEHRDYNDARKQKDKIVTQNGIRSAFVVAYNNGKRITVTEAKALLTQQQNK
jgi:hypothetical protein